MRTALVLISLLICSVAYADPCTCQQGNPCLCVFGCECKAKPKPPDPIKPPPISVNVPPACCCAVGDSCGCAPGHCHCASAAWKAVPDTQGDQIALFKGNRQVGSYRYSEGVFRPLLGDSWGAAQKPPFPLPARRQNTELRNSVFSAPQSFFPQIRSGGRSGGC